MHIEIIPCSFDNYAYLVICEERREALIVDPAEYYPVVNAVQRQDVKLRAVFCSHHHADHIGGLEELVDDFPDLAVYGHESDRQRIPGLNCPVPDGAAISVGSLIGEVLHTPGHTSGSVCLLLDGHVFTGDTLFGAGCGRLFEGTPGQMYHAINSRLATLPPTTLVYFGHEYTVHNLRFASFVEPDNGEVGRRMNEAIASRERGVPTSPSTIAAELATNPFMRCTQPGLHRLLQRKLGFEDTDPVAVFAEVRRLKDGF